MKGRLFDVLNRATTSLLRLDGSVDALPGRTVLLSAMRVREAQASSKIENTFATVRDMALAAIDEARASDPALEVVRNRRAIEAGLSSSLPVCNRLVQEMHRVLVIDAKHRPGKFRDRQVCIGDEHRGFAAARFVPPPPARVDACMRNWEEFCNRRDVTTGALSRPYFFDLAIAHYQFEAIHPFSDGNGRLGRALVTLAPVKDKILQHPVCNLSEWVHAHRDQYYDRLLRVSTHGEWEEWIRFFCTALAEQAEADQERAKRVANLYSEYQEKITSKAKSILRTRLLDHLFEHHAVSIPQAKEILKVTYPAAKRHIDAFITLNILRPYADRTYGKIYIANEIIKAIRGQGED